MNNTTPAQASRSYWGLVWAQFRNDKLAFAGLIMIGVLFLMAISAPLLAQNKPILMKVDGVVSAPLLRDIFAPPQGTPEAVLERLFNFALVFGAGALIVLPATWLTAPRRRRRGALLVAVAILTGICILPFLLVQSRLDKTDYRELVSQIRETPGNWAVMPLVPYGPYEQPRDVKPYQSVSSEHLMGTDRSRRDVLVRIIHGARVSLSVGFLAVGVAVAIGLFVGSVSAYHGGWTDIILQRVVEIVICFPTFLLILTIMAFVDKRSIFNVMLVIGLTGWTGVTRLVRNEMLSQKQLDYVAAAQALGFSSWRIMFRHLLPNCVAPVLVAATFGVAGAILTEAALSFLGFGVQPPTASWGELLNQAQTWPTGYWWLTTWPGLMIFLTVTLFNLVGEGLRDALDPRLRT